MAKTPQKTKVDVQNPPLMAVNEAMQILDYNVGDGEAEAKAWLRNHPPSNGEGILFVRPEFILHAKVSVQRTDAVDVRTMEDGTNEC